MPGIPVLTIVLVVNTYRRSFLALFLQRVVSEPFYLECFCGPKEPLEPVVVNLYLAVVHKVEKAPEIIFANISEDDNGVLTRVALHKK